MTTFRRILTGAALLAMASGITQQLAKADIITSLVSDFANGSGSCTAGVGQFCYIYDVALSSTATLTPSAGFSEFGTLYDVSKTAVAVAPGSLTGALATSFSFSTGAGLVPPAAFNQSTSIDNPTFFSLRYTFNGSASIVGPSDLGHFEIDSTAAPAILGGNYDGQTLNNTNNSEQGNSGAITVPGVVPSSTPEPATSAMLGGALLAFGLLGRRFKRS
jgi:hypothetical protein